MPLLRVLDRPVHSLGTRGDQVPASSLASDDRTPRHVPNGENSWSNAAAGATPLIRAASPMGPKVPRLDGRRTPTAANRRFPSAAATNR